MRVDNVYDARAEVVISIIVVL